MISKIHQQYLILSNVRELQFLFIVYRVLFILIYCKSLFKYTLILIPQPQVKLCKFLMQNTKQQHYQLKPQNFSSLQFLDICQYSKSLKLIKICLETLHCNKLKFAFLFDKYHCYHNKTPYSSLQLIIVYFCIDLIKILGIQNLFIYVSWYDKLGWKRNIKIYINLRCFQRLTNCVKYNFIFY